MKVFESFMKFYENERIPGGKGDGLDASDVDEKQLRVGIAVEYEHTNNVNIAREIALDHLAEDPEYYTKLIQAGIVDEKPALDLAKELGILESLYINESALGDLQIKVLELLEKSDLEDIEGTAKKVAMILPVRSKMNMLVDKVSNILVEYKDTVDLDELSNIIVKSI